MLYIQYYITRPARFKEDVNVLLKIGFPEIPVNQIRNYYKIYIDEKFFKQTDYFFKGTEKNIYLTLTSGRHIIRLERYIISAGNKNTYKRDKNINQAEPFTLNIQKNFYYVAGFTRAKSSSNKPFQLVKYVIPKESYPR